MSNCINCNIPKNTNRPRCFSCAQKERFTRMKAWNAGKKGVQIGSNKGRKFSKAWKEKLSKAKLKRYSNKTLHPRWKGDQVGYVALHSWVKKYLIKPQTCRDCNQPKALQLSNISGKYKRKLSDWQWLCAKCHKRYDRENKSYAKELFERSNKINPSGYGKRRIKNVL